MTQRSTTQVVGAALVGTAVGAGLALLFAPRSGKETREHIHEGYDHLKQGAHDKVDRLKAAARSTGKKVKDQAPVLSAWEEEV